MADPQDLFKREIGWFLSKLKKEQLYHPIGERLWISSKSFFEPDPGEDYFLTPSQQEKVFYKLEDLGIIRDRKTDIQLVQLGSPSQKTENVYKHYFNFLIDRETFDKTYKKFATKQFSQSEEVVDSTCELVTEKRVGYIKFYRQGPKIKIGAVSTRKFRLLNSLMPIGITKTVGQLFEDIRLSRDSNDGDLSNEVVGPDRERTIIEHTMKELQKIDQLKGKIRLKFVQNGRSVQLILGA